MAFLMLLPLACTQEQQGRSGGPEADIAATYNLVSIAGNPVPTGSGSITLNSDGTLTSVMDWGGGDIHRFEGTYVKEGDEYVLTWAGAGRTWVTIDGPKLTMNNEGTLFVYQKTDVAPVTTELAESQPVLDRFLGSWNWKLTTYGSGTPPEERHATGRSTYTRVLGGNFVEEDGEDSEKGFSLVLYTYDQRRKCFPLWVFLSKYGGPDTPYRGAWNESTHTIEWAGTTADGQSITILHHFVSDDTFESNIVARDSAGQILWRQEYEFTRQGESQQASQSTVEGGTPAVSQVAEQKVLDHLLGTWRWEAPGHKNATGTYEFVRTLGGAFVRGWTPKDAEANEVLLLYTYDPTRKCYRYWPFLTGGGCDNPVNGTWNETAHTMDWTGLDNNQIPLSARYRFLSDNTFECTVLLSHQSGQEIYRAEYKMTRLSDAQSR